jgi:hypothetical protein
MLLPPGQELGSACTRSTSPRWYHSDEFGKKVADETTPYGDEINKGGALYYQNYLKRTDEMVDTENVRIMKFKGLSYMGSEDVTEKVREIGRHRLNEAANSDIMLRKYRKIALESKGGPTPEELKKQIEAGGENYEIALDMANRAYGVRTRYNEDGTVGEWLNNPRS